MPRQNLIQFRKGTTAEWAAAPYDAVDGEPLWDTEKNILRLGRTGSQFDFAAAVKATFYGDVGTPGVTPYADADWFIPNREACLPIGGWSGGSGNGYAKLNHGSILSTFGIESGASGRQESVGVASMHLTYHLGTGAAFPIDSSSGAANIVQHRGSYPSGGGLTVDGNVNHVRMSSAYDYTVDASITGDGHNLSLVNSSLDGLNVTVDGVGAVGAVSKQFDPANFTLTSISPTLTALGMQGGSAWQAGGAIIGYSGGGGTVGGTAGVSGSPVLGFVNLGFAYAGEVRSDSRGTIVNVGYSANGGMVGATGNKAAGAIVSGIGYGGRVEAGDPGSVTFGRAAFVRGQAYGSSLVQAQADLASVAAKTNGPGSVRALANGVAAHVSAYMNLHNGSYATASGDVATAMFKSTAADQFAVASGDAATAIASGGRVTASGAASHARGFGGITGDGDTFADLALITASGSGSTAIGFANSYYGEPATIQATGSGSFAGGSIEGFFAEPATIQATRAGAFAFGFMAYKGEITASGFGAVAMGYTQYENIIASGNGSLALGGVSLNGVDDIVASGLSAMQLGPGTNAVDYSLQVGSSIHLHGADGTPAAPKNGDIWQANGNIYARTGGVTKNLSNIA
jgi:hypothetical protein